MTDPTILISVLIVSVVGLAYRLGRLEARVSTTRQDIRLIWEAMGVDEEEEEEEVENHEQD